MLETILLGLLTNYIAVTIKIGSTKLLKKGPIYIAIIKTATKYSHIEKLDYKLIKFCSSDEFQSVKHAFVTAGPDISDDILSTLRESDFFQDDTIGNAAEEILYTFEKMLDKEILTSPEIGLYYHDQKQTALMREIREDVKIVKDQTAGSVSIEASASSSEEESYYEKTINAKLDTVKDLINNGRQKSAKDALDSISEEASKNELSSIIKSRIATYYGICALDNKNIEEAGEHFRNAYDLNPEDPVAIIHMAVVFNNESNKKAAIEYATKANLINKKEPKIMSPYLQIMHAQEQHEEIDRLIIEEPWINEDSDCCFILGDIMMDRDKPEAAEEYFRKALK